MLFRSEVATNDDLLQAGSQLRSIATQLQELELLRKSITRPLDDMKRTVMDLFREDTHRLEEIEQSLKSSVTVFRLEAEKKRRLEEARLRDAQALQAAAASTKAKELIAKGKIEQAEAVLDTVPPVPVVVADIPKTNLGSRTSWDGEVEDFDAFVRYALEYMPNLIQVNEKALAEFARATKGTATIPGVKFVKRESVVVR